MTTKFGCLLLMALSIAVGSPLPAAEVPGWVTSRRDQRFPEKLYLLAVGQASGRRDDQEVARNAEMLASQQIAQQLQLRISSSISILKIEDSAKGAYADQTRQDISATTSLKLSGLRIADRHYDSKNRIHYALALLDKQVATAALRQECASLRNAIQASLQTARRRVEERQPLEAIRLAHQAASARAACAEREALLVVLGDFQSTSTESGGTLMMHDITSLLMEIGAGLRFTPQSEMPIQLRPGERSASLIASAHFHEIPLRNAHYAATPVKGRCHIEFQQTPHDSGDFVIILSQFAAAPHGHFKIEVNLPLAEFALDTLLAESQLWNNTLVSSFQPMVISVEKQDLELDDYCAGAIQDLANKLPERSKLFTLGFGSITFSETGASSAFYAFLMDKLSAAAAEQQKFRPVAAERIEASLRQARLSYKGEKRPDRPEIIAELIEADGLLYGTCWEHEDQLEITLQIAERSTATGIASTTMNLPRRLVPSNLSWLPENYSAFLETQKLGDIKSSRTKLAVDVWAERGSGAVYHEGENITIYARASSDCYLYLIYHDAGGNDILIFPNRKQPNNRILGNIIYQIPDQRDQFKWVVSKPFGSEIIKAVCSDHVLADLPGRELPNGLKVLQGSLDTLIHSLRDGFAITTSYAESSCILTTIE